MNKRVFVKKMLIWDFIFFILLNALDRVAKYFVQLYCKKDDFVILDDIFEITYLENYGGSFGILNNQRFFFIFISALFISLIVFFICVLPNNRKFNGLNIWLTFMVAGTAGNMIDRIMYGYVLDFIYIPKINFPVFNLSDIWITFGAFFTIIIVLFRLKEKDFEFMNFKQNKYREIK